MSAGTRVAALRQIDGQETNRRRNMAKYNRNSGKPWTGSEVSRLRALARENTPTRVISLKMGRTPAAVQSKASEKGISLKPTNQSPYGRR